MNNYKKDNMENMRNLKKPQLSFVKKNIKMMQNKKSLYSKFIVFIISFFLLFLAVPLSTMAESSLKFESSVAFDLFFDDDAKVSLGNYEYLGLTVDSIDIEGFRLFAQLKLFIFQNYYIELLSPKVTAQNPYIFTLQQLYSKISLESITLDIGIKQDIDLNNIVLNPFSPYQRLLLNGGFSFISLFQIHYRQFIGDFLASVKWYPSTEGFHKDIVQLEFGGNFGDFSFMLPFIYDSNFDYVRAGFDMQFFLLTQWHMVSALHFSGNGYEGFETKFGFMHMFSDVIIEIFYYYNGIPFTSAEIVTAMAIPALIPSYNLNRLLVSQRHLAFASLMVNPDPFTALGLRALAVFEPFDLLLFIDVTIQVNTNVSIMAAVLINPDLETGDLSYYYQMMYKSQNGGMLSLKLKYIF